MKAFDMGASRKRIQQDPDRGALQFSDKPKVDQGLRGFRFWGLGFRGLSEVSSLEVQMILNPKCLYGTK